LTVRKVYIFVFIENFSIIFENHNMLAYHIQQWQKQLAVIYLLKSLYFCTYSEVYTKIF